MTQAKAKSNSVVTTQWSEDILSITVLQGQLVGGMPTDATAMFDRTKASEANRDQAEKHGWTQRLCDSMAKSAPSRAAGQSEAQWLETLAGFKRSKFQAVEDLIAYYESGEVNWKRAGGGRDGTMLLDALCELRSDKSREQLTKFLESRTAEQLKVICKIPELIVIVNRLRVERMKPVDMGDALGDLDAMGEVTVDEEISALMTDQ